MGAGMNGQSFAFNGYLPKKQREQSKQIRFFEERGYREQQTQVFIETPYRNNKLVEILVDTLRPTTALSIACDITLPSQYILTKSVSEWKKSTRPDL